MKLVIGLGNPGQKYELTRHNLGFIFLNKLRDKWSFPNFSEEKKFNAEISQGEIAGEKIILAKPQNFMNLSGETVKKLMTFYKISVDNLLVIHDDVDISCGKYKLATESSSAGHNGVQNIIDNLGTKKFARLRIGVKKETDENEKEVQMETSDFVLGKLEITELEKITSIEKSILGEVEKIIV
ncbi:MAG: aminoacyl-tRNA hydrolase [Candidatus Moraniibacteriota bacterium]